MSGLISREITRLRRQLSETDAGDGSDAIAYKAQQEALAVLTTVKEKLDRTVDIVDLGGMLDGTNAQKNYSAMQRLLDKMTRPTTLILPQGFIALDRALQCAPGITVGIRGHGMYSSTIDYTGDFLQALFLPSAGTVEQPLFEGFTVLGNDRLGSIFNCEEAIAAYVHRVMAQGLTSFAFRLNNGYSNTVQGCRVFSSKGGLLDASGVNIHNLNLIENHTYSVDGIGAIIGNGFNATLTGNHWERCKVAAIIAYDMGNLNVRGEYCERNGEVGYDYGGGLVVKSDIHLLAGGKQVALAPGQEVQKASIVDMTWTPVNSGEAGPGQDSFVFIGGAGDVNVERVHIYDPLSGKFKGLVGIVDDSTRTAFKSLRLVQNENQDIVQLGAATAATVLTGMHKVRVEMSGSAHNYAPASVSGFVAVSGTTGSLAAYAGQTYKGAQVYEILPGDRRYQFTVDLTGSTDLQGKHVWFGVPYKIREADGSNIRLAINGNTDHDGTRTEATNGWQFRSVHCYVPDDATQITIALERTGAGTLGAWIGKPVLSMVGNNDGAYVV